MKKSLLLLTVLLLVTATVTASAVFEFKHHQNVTNTAVARAEFAKDVMQTQRDSYRQQLQAADSENSTLVTTKSGLCQLLTANKLKSTLCQ